MAIGQVLGQTAELWKLYDHYEATVNRSAGGTQEEKALGFTLDTMANFPSDGVSFIKYCAEVNGTVTYVRDASSSYAYVRYGMGFPTSSQYAGIFYDQATSTKSGETYYTTTLDHVKTTKVCVAMGSTDYSAVPSYSSGARFYSYSTPIFYPAIKTGFYVGAFSSLTSAQLLSNITYNYTVSIDVYYM